MAQRILDVNLLLDDGFNPVVVVYPSGGLFIGTNATVCWSCAAGGVMGGDGTLSSTEDGGVLLSECGIHGRSFRYFGRGRWIGKESKFEVEREGT